MTLPEEKAPTVRLHASCVVRDGAAVLLTGPSGSGKSDLALRAIGAGWRLVGDDQVLLGRHGDRLIATAPAQLAGWIEVRGIGIVSAPYSAHAKVCCAIELTREPIVRMPEPTVKMWLGISVMSWRLDPFEASALEKLSLAVQIGDGVTRMRT